MLLGEASNDKSACRFILHPTDREEEWNDGRSQVRIVFELLNVAFMLCPSPYSNLNETQKCKNSHCRNMKDSWFYQADAAKYILNKIWKSETLVEIFRFSSNMMQNIKCNSYILHQRILLCFFNFKELVYFQVWIMNRRCLLWSKTGCVWNCILSKNDIF